VSKVQLKDSTLIFRTNTSAGQSCWCYPILFLKPLEGYRWHHINALSWVGTFSTEISRHDISFDSLRMRSLLCIILNLQVAVQVELGSTHVVGVTSTLSKHVEIFKGILAYSISYNAFSDTSVLIRAPLRGSTRRIATFRRG
jgi:hypothetical protein